MTDIALYGAGGLGREVACMIRRINSEIGPTWNFIGFFDDFIPAGTRTQYGTVLGNIDTLNSWPKPLSIVFSIGSPQIVKGLKERTFNTNLEFPNLISPDVVWIDKESVTIGKGNILCTRCLISCNVSIGDFNLFANDVVLGHDSSIGNFNCLLPAVKVSGAVSIGNRNFMGVNSVVLQCVDIGNDTIVGASGVVISNTEDCSTYIGIPAKKI